MGQYSLSHHVWKVVFRQIILNKQFVNYLITKID